MDLKQFFKYSVAIPHFSTQSSDNLCCQFSSPFHDFVEDLSLFLSFYHVYLELILSSDMDLCYRWPFGEVGCHIRGFIVCCALSANIMALVLIGLNRYIMVVHPAQKHLVASAGMYRK